MREGIDLLFSVDQTPLGDLPSALGSCPQKNMTNKPQTDEVQGKSFLKPGPGGTIGWEGLEEAATERGVGGGDMEEVRSVGLVT